MLSTKPIERRRASRYAPPEHIIVKAKLSDDEFWKEKASLKSVSRLGAGFEIEKPCKIGQLISLLIPMPAHLRLYDHDKQLYRVWGLVQHCHAVSNEEFSGYNVGVAFVGKDAPQSFYHKPDQSYRITGLNEEGVWSVTEAEREFINRKHPRLWFSLSAELIVDGAAKENSDSENSDVENSEDTETQESTEKAAASLSCQTENISRSGAAVFCETSVSVGDHVKFVCSQFDFETDAIVRNRRGNGNTTPKIHLEFLENEFPIEKLDANFEGK